MRSGAGEPHGHVRGLKRLGHAKQVVRGIEVDGVPQSGGERGHDGLGVVAGAVEPAVDQAAPAAQWVKQRRDDQRGDGHRDRRPERQDVGGQQDRPENTPASRAVISA